MCLRMHTVYIYMYAFWGNNFALTCNYYWLSQGYSKGLSPNFKRDAYICSGAMKISKDTETFKFSPWVEGIGWAHLLEKKTGRRLGTESMSLWHELLTALPMNKQAACSCWNQRQGLPTKDVEISVRLVVLLHPTKQCGLYASEHDWTANECSCYNSKQKLSSILGCSEENSVKWPLNWLRIRVENLVRLRSIEWKVLWPSNSRARKINRVILSQRMPSTRVTIQLRGKDILSKT